MPDKTEAQYWSSIKKYLPDGKRLESSTNSVWDVYWMQKGTVAWYELKIAYGNSVKVRGSQLSFGRNLMRQHVLGYYLVYVKGSTWVYERWQGPHLKEEGINHPPAWVLSDKYDWEAFIERVHDDFRSLHGLPRINTRE